MVNMTQTATITWTHTATRPLTFIIVDDTRSYRNILSRIITTQPHWQIIDEAVDGLRALELVTAHTPDIVCMDINLPLLDGIAATRRIKEIVPATHVLLISGYDDEEFQREALAAGAACLLRKEDVDEHSFTERISTLFHNT